MGLTPAFKLLANNVDVTAHLNKNLVSISFVDADGIKADKVEIKVFGEFKRPKYKDKLKLYLYYKEDKEEFFCGVFIVQNTSWNIDNTLNISATATDFNAQLKVFKNRNFEQKSVKDIVEFIANEHNLKSKCDFEDIYYPYISQTNESDIAFLGRIAKDLNAVYSIKNETIIFLRQDEKNTLKTIIIDAKDCASLVIKNSNKTYYKSATLKYQDTKNNKIQTVKIGTQEPIYNIQETFTDKTNLEFKAKAKLETLNKGIKSGTFKIYGFGIYARSNLKFINIKLEDNITYHIDTITHTLDTRGWNMQIEFSNSAI